MVDVTGALLGLAFSELFTAIKAHVRKISLFGSYYRTLKSTLETIEPLFNDIALLNKMLDRRSEELSQFHELLKDGKDLVDKCSRINPYNLCFKKIRADELTKLDGEIKRFIQTLTVIIARDVKDVAVDVKGLRSGVEMLIQHLGIESGRVMNSGAGGGYNGKYVPPKAPDFVTGMDEQCKEVKSRLSQDKVSVVVISGAGGVGKTTLAKKIFHDEEIKGKFGENAFFFPVSDSFDPIPIIQKMRQHKKLPESYIRTEDDAFNAFEELVKEIGENPILLVLDDVWSETESLLKKKFIRNKRDYKILVTSRFEFPGFGPPIRLGPLSDKYAKDLLLHAATPMNGPPKLDDETVDEMVRRCKRLPLALEVVGKSLCGRHPDVWQGRLSEWDDGVSVLDSYGEIPNCLRKSLADFSSGSETQDCFMDLGSFPEDHMIPACTLIDMWAELYNLGFDGVRAMPILHELSNRSLADLVVNRTDGDGKNKGYESDYVTQHDLLRQLAIQESSKEPIERRKRVMMHIRGNTLPMWWIEQKEQPINAKLLSISTDERFSSRWPDLDAHAAEVVVLNFRTNNYSLPEFIGRMTKLKALIVANNSYFPAELTNFPLLGSMASLKRIRLERIRIPFLQMENIQLYNLERISLFMCDISNEELLSGDAMPNLLEVSVAYCKNLKKLPARFCNAKRLRKLRITNCPDLRELPQSIGEQVNLDILMLNSCTSLRELPDAIGNLQNMTVLDISDCLDINELPDQIGQLSNLKEFRMEGRLNLSKLPQSVEKLGSLKKVTCHESNADLWNRHKLHLTHLEVKTVPEEISLAWLKK